MEVVKTMIHDQDLPMNLWAQAIITIVYVKNRLSHSGLGFKTLEEMYTGNKLELIHLNIFGFLVYVHILKENKTKMDPSGKKGIFVGYYEVSKAFRIYILGFHHIEISRDVKFNEEMALNKSRRCHLEELHEEDVPPKRIEANPSPEIVAIEDHDMLEPQDPPIMDISRKRKTDWVREIIQE